MVYTWVILIVMQLGITRVLITTLEFDCLILTAMIYTTITALSTLIMEFAWGSPMGTP